MSKRTLTFKTTVHTLNTAKTSAQLIKMLKNAITVNDTSYNALRLTDHAYKICPVVSNHYIFGKSSPINARNEADINWVKS